MLSESNKDLCRERPGPQTSGFFERLKSVLLVLVGNLGPPGREAACTGRGEGVRNLTLGEESGKAAGWPVARGPLSTTPAPNKQERRERTCVAPASPQQLEERRAGKRGRKPSSQLLPARPGSC